MVGAAFSLTRRLHNQSTIVVVRFIGAILIRRASIENVVTSISKKTKIRHQKANHSFTRASKMVIFFRSISQRKIRWTIEGSNHNHQHHN